VQFGSSKSNAGNQTTDQWFALGDSRHAPPNLIFMVLTALHCIVADNEIQYANGVSINVQVCSQLPAMTLYMLLPRKIAAAVNVLRK